MHARLASVAAALALLAILVIRSAIGPIGVRATAPLPACAYADLLTSPRSYDDWSTTLVDTLLSVPSTYVPPDLVSVSEAGFSGDGRVRAIVIEDLRAMRLAAARAGAPLGVESAYRSYSEQQQVFDAWVKHYGYAKALRTPARPGHSEHQLGVAIDFRTDPPTTSGVFGSSAAGKWMAAHAWEYGFVMSYPKDSTALTCYDGEPWHFRYVGRELAAEIQASGLTVRAYLWSHFTTTIVPPSAKATIAPLPLPGPTSTPAASPDPSPGVSPTAQSGGASASPLVLAPSASPPTAPVAIEPIDPAVVAGAQPALVLVAGVAFAVIIGGAWLAGRRRRPGPVR